MHAVAINGYVTIGRSTARNVKLKNRPSSLVVQASGTHGHTSLAVGSVTFRPARRKASAVHPRARGRDSKVSHACLFARATEEVSGV